MKKGTEMTSNECTILRKKVKSKRKERRSDFRPTRWQRQALARAIRETREALNHVTAIGVFANPRWWEKEGKA